MSNQLQSLAEGFSANFPLCPGNRRPPLSEKLCILFYGKGSEVRLLPRVFDDLGKIFPVLEQQKTHVLCMVYPQGFRRWPAKLTVIILPDLQATDGLGVSDGAVHSSESSIAALHGSPHTSDEILNASLLVLPQRMHFSRREPLDICAIHERRPEVPPSCDSGDTGIIKQDPFLRRITQSPRQATFSLKPDSTRPQLSMLHSKISAGPGVIFTKRNAKLRCCPSSWIIQASADRLGFNKLDRVGILAYGTSKVSDKRRQVQAACPSGSTFLTRQQQQETHEFHANVVCMPPLALSGAWRVTNASENNVIINTTGDLQSVGTGSDELSIVGMNRDAWWSIRLWEGGSCKD
ncbi:hypothetical protein B0H16DRAFT_1465892 [Mycena metata]|uniref:Uncharacterized protein n=1 Tax=Mycena metata TaxID=1033252 RepID=A0AAD7I9J1_9AGAR|nr:hypothetical protein B0H16DRAFT_1465892 [Mycena metata]